MGRPLKYGRPARSITLTLPEDTIAALRTRDRDIGRAVVALLPVAAPAAARPPAVVLHQTASRAVIVIRPVDAVRRLRGVDLISLGDPDRALIAFTDGMTPAAFELQVLDLLEGPALAPAEREVVKQLAALLRQVRRTGRQRLSEATIIVLEDADRSRASERRAGAVSGTS